MSLFQKVESGGNVAFFKNFFLLFVDVNRILTAEKTSKQPDILSEIREQSSNFDPNELGQHLDDKGRELFGMAQSGSTLYISIALIVFILLLIGGIFVNKLVKIAFSVLFVSIIGFIIINYWPEIVEVAKGIFVWLTNPSVDVAPDSGGDNIENSSSV